MKPRVHFVLPKGERVWGSTFLRGTQFCEIAQERLGQRYDFGMLPMPIRRKRQRRTIALAIQCAWAARQPKADIYFVTKQAIQKLDPLAADILKSRTRAVIFDYVDADMAITGLHSAHVHLCSSLRQLDHVEARLRAGAPGKAELLLHGYDARLDGLDLPPPQGFSPVYFGLPRNAVIPEALKDRIPMVEAKFFDRAADTFAQVGGYSLHYCVRPMDGDPGEIVFKPFTKGATAAVFSANVLVNAAAHDALDLLGEDYPYIVPRLDDAEIVDTFTRAEQGFGGRDWLAAREVMRDLRDRLSPRATAERLDAILRPLAV